jgi:hypothetical protein
MVVGMDAPRSTKVLVVHPVLALAQRYAAHLDAAGFAATARDDLSRDFDAATVSGLVLCGAVHWWLNEEHQLPPTVLVGGDAPGLVRAAGATRCRDGASPEEVVVALRSLLRLSRHSRGRGTMPIRLSGSPNIVKVGRWMTVPPLAGFDDDLEPARGDLAPTAQ